MTRAVAVALLEGVACFLIGFGLWALVLVTLP